MRRTDISLAFALALACILSTTAQAGWQGQTITGDWYVPDNLTVIETHNLLVGPGVELPFGSITNGGNVSIDVSDVLIRFDFSSLAIWSPASFNGWNFSQTTGAGPNIVGASLGSMSPGISGLTNAAISFDANSVSGNFVGVAAAGAGDFYTIKVQFAVPEPTGLIQAAFGFTLLATICYRRRFASWLYSGCR